jgi:hypothetical protein
MSGWRQDCEYIVKLWMLNMIIILQFSSDVGLEIENNYWSHTYGQ